MTLYNNGSIFFTQKLLPEELLTKLNEDFDVIIRRETDEVGDPRDFLSIEDECGDINNWLNELVSVLAEYDIAPENGTAISYYGDYDGYEVYVQDKQMFVSMDPEDYGVWQYLNGSNRQKVVIFIHDGVVEGGFTSDPNIDVTICDFDKNMDDRDAENAFWDECKAAGLRQFSPNIYHPSDGEDDEEET